MPELNPYNCTKPGNLFVGYEELRKKLLNGFRNGNSYAVIGGRRCGKTSLLMQIEKDLQKEYLSPFHPIPRRFSLQEHSHSLTPDQLFEKIYNLVIRNINAPSWKKSEPGKEYQNFLEHLDKANPTLSEKYSPDWLAVLLIDEMDAAVSYLPDDQFFQNLRNFLMESRFHRHFRLVATGVREMARLISSGSSPLNNLRNTYLRILTNQEAQKLVNYGFYQRCDTYGELEYMFQLTGRHAFVLQGLLEELWVHETAWDYDIIKRASDDFLRQHKDFKRWYEAFEPAEKEVYNFLAKSLPGKINLNAIKSSTDTSLQPEIRDAVTLLNCHGVIDAGSLDDIKIAGTMFRDWFLENFTAQEIKHKMKVFISYAEQDKEMAKKLHNDLKRASIKPWMESEDFFPGQNKKLAVREAIKESSYFLALLSTHSVSKRGFVHKEIKIALDILDELPNSEVFVIPIRLDDCKIIDETLDDLYPVDLFTSYETGLKHILRALGKSDKTESVPGQPEKETSPLSSTSAQPQKETSPPSPPAQVAVNMDKTTLKQNINCFSWLHLTDFHQGMEEQPWLWPGVKHILFEDLKKLHHKCGPWDLVIFTGDLTQRGSAEEFSSVDEILDQLWDLFHKLGSSPKLLAVPGNHDLARPDTKDPSVRLLRMWDSMKDVQKEFWNEPGSPYRQVIGNAFENYTSWWDNHSLRPGNIKAGTLPGDFSASISINKDIKIGIVGLNTTFLQLTGDDYEGKLAVHARQFHEMCDGDGPNWAKQHHACLLLTHHPPGWLNKESKEHMNAEITSHGRFAAHLCGHLHETAYRDISEGGSDPRRIWQGRSLFGLEYFDQKQERLHGYTAGRIEFEGDNGKLLFWPREARLQGVQRKIAPDYSLDLDDDQHTNPKKFTLLRPFK